MKSKRNASFQETFSLLCLYEQINWKRKKIGKQHRSSSEMRKASVFQLEKLKEARFIKNLLFYQWTPKRNKQSLRKNVKKINKDTNFSCSVSKQKRKNTANLKIQLNSRKKKFFKPASSAFLDAKSLSLNLVPCCWSTSSTTEATEIEKIPSDAIFEERQREIPLNLNQIDIFAIKGPIQEFGNRKPRSRGS